MQPSLFPVDFAKEKQKQAMIEKNISAHQRDEEIRNKANEIYEIKKQIDGIKNDHHSGAGIGVGVVFFIIGLMLCIAFCQAGRIGIGILLLIGTPFVGSVIATPIMYYLLEKSDKSSIESEEKRIKSKEQEQSIIQKNYSAKVEAIDEKLKHEIKAYEELYTLEAKKNYSRFKLSPLADLPVIDDSVKCFMASIESANRDKSVPDITAHFLIKINNGIISYGSRSYDFERENRIRINDPFQLTAFAIYIAEEIEEDVLNQLSGLKRRNSYTLEYTVNYEQGWGGNINVVGVLLKYHEPNVAFVPLKTI